MLADCDTCAARGAVCDECLAGPPTDVPEGPGWLTVDEHRAIEVLAQAGFGVRVLAAPHRPSRRTARRTFRRGSGCSRRRDRQVA